MVTLSFGNFPVDMTDDAFLDSILPAGEPDLLNFSSTSLTGIFPDGSTITIVGRFDFSSVDNFLNNSFVTGIVLLDDSDELIFSITGIPPITFAEANNLSDAQIDALIEHQNYTINGNSFDDILVGTHHMNTLNGFGGDDLLQDDLGNDVLRGGDGNDTLEAGRGNDVLFGGPGADVLDGGPGSDTAVYIDSPAGVSINLLTGEVSGGDADGDVIIGIENVVGSDHADIMIGNAAINRFTGGSGDDLYRIGNGDIVIESLNAGTDTILSDVPMYTLPANVENLFLLSNGVNGTGNNLDNMITGYSWDNVLSGMGGNDMLFGNNGNDVLLGGAGNDYLDGGAGNDRMTGGMGNDTYVVNRGDGAGIAIDANREDIVIEAPGAGIDTVISYMYTYTLGANVENLEIMGITGRHGFGNALNNEMTGNDNNNILSGDAGNDTLNGKDGNDILSGGAGADNFVFDTALSAGNVDRVTDFTAGVDKIQLDVDIFTALTVGALASENFVTGTAALDADDFIIYNSSTGQLFYDADGNGVGDAAQLFAQLSGAPALSASDIDVIA